MGRGYMGLDLLMVVILWVGFGFTFTDPVRTFPKLSFIRSFLIAPSQVLLTS